jgi:hypothetical protein
MSAASEELRSAFPPRPLDVQAAFDDGDQPPSCRVRVDLGPQRAASLVNLPARALP